MISQVGQYLLQTARKMSPTKGSGEPKPPTTSPGTLLLPYLGETLKKKGGKLRVQPKLYFNKLFSEQANLLTPFTKATLWHFHYLDSELISSEVTTL